jgi:exodeoxyribonuclease VII large subunit
MADHLTVSELTEIIKNTLKNKFTKAINVTGEVSNFKISKNNLFFTLKDENSSINCTVWDYLSKTNITDNINGQKIKVFGNITIFSKSGSYNLNIYKVEIIGIGNLHQEYVKLKEHFNCLGYFNDNNKKQLPSIIMKVAIITALGGAALQDFLYVINKNKYVGQIYVQDAVVQGRECAQSISQSLLLLDKLDFDVIVIARGGGSFEDLYGFSNELIIEEIYNCKTCVISAIGHEIDFMLSDFVADIRAPTPSIAGELISANNNYKYDKLTVDNLVLKLKNIIDDKLKYLEYNMNLFKKIESPKNILNNIFSEIDNIKNNILNKIQIKINNFDRVMSNIGKIINNNSDPNNILNKGFCIVLSDDNKKINNLKEFDEILKGKKKLKLKFIDGMVSFDLRSIKKIN